MGTTSRDASYIMSGHDIHNHPDMTLSRLSRLFRTNHPSAGEDVPAETHAISVLYLTPLLFEGLVIHICEAVALLLASVGRKLQVGQLSSYKNGHLCQFPIHLWKEQIASSGAK